MELLLSPEIRNAIKKAEKGTSDLRSTRPNFVLVLATRCLCWGEHLSSGQLDLTEYWSWPPGVSNGVGGGVHLSSGQPDPT